MQIEPDSGAAPPTAQQLEALQDTLGATLPPAYLAFLQQDNGGIPAASTFAVGRRQVQVERLLSVVEDPVHDPLGDYDIETVWSTLEDRLRPGLVPFAALVGGDYLCLDCHSRGTPLVLLWDQEHSDEGRPHLVKVAASFEAFLQLLH